MEVLYKSTRSNNVKVTASQAILKGLADDGGLFVPVSMPKLDKSMEEFSNLTYQETAYEVMKLFLTDFTEEELKYCINQAYDTKFDHPEIAPLKKAGDNYYLELFHGSTIAFKDMALSILPHLLTTSAKKNNVENEIVILTATSGDTGKAAMAGFADVKGTRIIVFYPKNGVSPIQEKQMLTQKGENTYVVGITGNFDDAQNGVKSIFNDRDFAEVLNKAGFQFSSANSINIGRLMPQVVYYVYAYSRLYKEGAVKRGELLDIAVPTGNFGNILSAYYAKLIGVPINKLICASNDNKVLYDFFQTGEYNRNREFILTSSPSMDILISSNLERLIYKITDENPDENQKLMNALSSQGVYQINEDMREDLKDFIAGYADESSVSYEIKQQYEECGYILDTHTAVAANVYRKYKQNIKDSNDKLIQSVIISTASPYKFARSVMESIDKNYKSMDEFQLIDELAKISGVPIPQAIEEIRTAPVIHNSECKTSDMKNTVVQILGL